MVEDDKRILNEGSLIQVQEEFNGRTYETIKFPIHHEGKPVYLAGFTIDITENKKMLDEILRAKEVAEKANQLKSEFLAQMSHEIRSPINTIVNFNTLIEEELRDKKSEEMDVCFSGIDSATKRVTRTIDLILNMSEIHLGTYEISNREINLSQILNNLVKEYKKLAAGKNLELVLKIETKNTLLKTDDYAVNQIFANLIDNAIKYTERGFVKVKVGENNKGLLIVEVIDTGKGISKEYLPRLFEPFTQEEQGYSRKYEGSGLGLSLIKNYCKLINAEISVDSEKGSGTVFTVVFNNEQTAS
jgi:signal transduction histidine kinase